MGYHNVLSKTDRALAAFLISQGAGTIDDTFALKHASTNPNPPATYCFSERGAQSHPHSGIYEVKSMVEVVTNAAPNRNEYVEGMRLDSDLRVQAVFDCFHMDLVDSGHALGELITNAARGSGDDMGDFTVISCIPTGIMQGRGQYEKQGEWTDTIELELIVCPANVT